MCEPLGLPAPAPPSGYSASGHSLHIGVAVSLAQTGAPIVDMQVPVLEILVNAGVLYQSRTHRTLYNRTIQGQQVVPVGVYILHYAPFPPKVVSLITKRYHS